MSKYLCANCLREFRYFEPPLQDDLTAKTSNLRDLPSDILINSAYSFVNGGIMQSVIHSFKYQEMPGLAKVCGMSGSSQVSETIGQYDYLIPIPLHRTRFSERGYNQSEMLALGMNITLAIPVAGRTMLRRVKQTPSQTGLNIEEREENVRGAFALSDRGKETFKGKRLLIIDDVMTTGATLASAAVTLMAARPKTVDLFALATVTD